MIRPNDRNAKPQRVQERDVSKACVDYLRLRGWHVERQNAGPYGRNGVPDYVALHYRKRASMWIEFKSPSDRRVCRCATMRRGRCTVCAQLEFARMVCGLGGEVNVFSNVDHFIGWYESHYGREGQLRLPEGP